MGLMAQRLLGGGIAPVYGAVNAIGAELSANVQRHQELLFSTLTSEQPETVLQIDKRNIPSLAAQMAHFGFCC